jgi:hypothetical protein
MRFSTILRTLAARPQERIAIGELLDAFGDRSFGAAMLLLAFPNMAPLPPGASALFGVPLILIAAQLTIGRETMWLPASIRRRSISSAVLARIVGLTRPHLRRVERLLTPRLGFLASGIGARTIGAACVLLAILIALPIPLANFLSGLAVSAFALGLLRHDGVAVLLGWAAGALSIGATVLVSGTIVIVVRRLLELLPAGL